MATYSDTPWWSNLIAVLATAVVSVIGTLYFMKSGAPGAPSVPSIGGLLKDTVTYIPHILLLFGVLADMFTMEGVYSIPSLVGLISIPLNWVFKYFWRGIQEVVGSAWEVLNYKNTTPPPIETRVRTGANVISGGGKFFDDYDGCTVQGFDWAKSKYAPQTLVVTATVFSYYMFDLIANRGWTNATATIVVFLVLFAGEALIVGNCATGESDEPSTLMKALAAFSEGLLFGGSSYAIVQAYYPVRLPSSVISPFPRKVASDLKRGKDGRYYDENGLPYNVLPNGQATPDLSDKDDKKNGFIDLLNESLGTGEPAIPLACPTKK